MPEKTRELELKRSVYRDWERASNRRLREIYGITIQDAGIEEAMLRCHWKMKQSPQEFVDWFGEKYDLDPISDYQF